MPTVFQHVVPVNDLEEHTIEEGYKCGVWTGLCKCDPDKKLVDPDERTWIIVHTSFDGREGVDWANDLLK